MLVMRVAGGSPPQQAWRQYDLLQNLDLALEGRFFVQNIGAEIIEVIICILCYAALSLNQVPSVHGLSLNKGLKQISHTEFSFFIVDT